MTDSTEKPKPAVEPPGLFSIEGIAKEFSMPWSPELYFSVRGAENVHIYFWVAKDICWMQDKRDPGMLFGTIALLWCGVLLYNHIIYKSTLEMYFLTVTVCWLCGNYSWMAGEIINHDDNLGANTGAGFMYAGISMILFYHVVLHRLHILTPNETQNKIYNDAGLIPRFSFFKTWREYEHFHTFCWLLKDVCWNRNQPELWVIFLIPTLVIAVDFIYVSFTAPKMFIDSIHYIVQFLWVIGNATWAGGELFNGNDKPVNLFHFTRDAYSTSRWYSSWILFCSYSLILFLYFLWLPLTAYGYIKHPGNRVNSNHDIELVVDVSLSDSPSHRVDDSDELMHTPEHVINPLSIKPNLGDSKLNDPSYFMKNRSILSRLTGRLGNKHMRLDNKDQYDVEAWDDSLHDIRNIQPVVYTDEKNEIQAANAVETTKSNFVPTFSIIEEDEDDSETV